MALGVLIAFKMACLRTPVCPSISQQTMLGGALFAPAAMQWVQNKLMMH